MRIKWQQMESMKIACAAAVCGAAVCGSVQAEEPMRMVHITGDDIPAIASHLDGEGYEVGGCDARVTGEFIELIVSSEEEARLRGDGLAVEVVRYGRPLSERDDVQVVGEPGVEVPSGYPDLASVIAQMQQAAADHPAICEFVDLTARYGTPVTEQGRRLYAVKISDNVASDEVEPAVLVVGCHHAREIMTPVIALEAIDRLVSGYGSDPRITDAVDNFEIWIAPMWNPDGYNHVFTVDDFWRKNRRNNGGGEWGVDQNRNYPFGWAQCGGSNSTWSSIYQGPSAASEPETQTMLALAADRRFARVGDFHSYASEVRYGYGCWFHPWDSFQQQTASALSAASGYNGWTASSCCLGGDIHMHGAYFGSQSFLWETGTSFQPSYSVALQEANQNWNGIIELIDRPIPIRGRVSDAGTGQPIDAEIELVGVIFTNGEEHNTNPRTGLYHAFPPNGSYTLRFTAAGYDMVEHTVNVTSVGVVLDVLMGDPCVADVNGDGLLTIEDVLAFIAAFSGGDPSADLNGDGVINLVDVTAFIDAFVAGC